MFVARSASRLTSSATSTLALSQSLRSICFDLTAQQREIQAHALKFAKEVIVPAAAYHDETGLFPWDIVRQAHALGFMNPGIEEKYGGPGLSHLESTLLTEALAYGCTGIQFCIIGSTLAVKPVQLAGTEAQKREYLGRQAASPSIAAYCVTEAGAGSDVAAVRTRAIRKGDEYVLTGSKSWISGGGHAQWFIVLARTAEDPSTPAGRAFTAFLVEGDAVGVSRGKKEDNMGQRCSDTRTITFEDVRVPVANVLGAVGEGFKVVMRTFDAMRPIIAAGALGLMWRCLEESARYAMERRTFGTAICNHQAVQFLLSDMAMNLELGRLATYKAASDSDLCLRNSYISSVAKCFVGDQVNVAATNAVQIFGANGYNRQYPVEKLMRDAKIYQIYGGTSEIQRTIIFRQMMEQIRATGTARV